MTLIVYSLSKVKTVDSSILKDTILEEIKFGPELAKNPAFTPANEIMPRDSLSNYITFLFRFLLLFSLDFYPLSVPCVTLSSSFFFFLTFSYHQIRCFPSIEVLIFPADPCINTVGIKSESFRDRNNASS